MRMARESPTIATLYAEDFYLWLESTVKSLKERDLKNLDWENLIEEIEALGNEQRRKVESYLRQLLVHLLSIGYWERERSYCDRGWKAEIRNFRAELDFLLKSKTLSNYLLQQFDRIYSQARKIAIDKTGLPAEIFPIDCPFSFEQTLNSDYLPD